ncbi:RNA polymerase sigma-70 factor (ECF subfamily) [Clostridium punense]|uniref:RNA polymerase sigma-70 factor (ECF subfamily) n=1 Tax=Clostridium punense TaxID=1054297 RepID=A0ABS4K827_9CLOT|nr:sigma-70 family RNA polymerase sigma factor [Clostridium sp. BL8]EQB88778.1 hypothetical protein M918_23045 [Clostridium sp. BL8]MBP2023936.1 RNA polymerase sigma-70 factor (ECF subfamily) [Clostridium punense]
MKTLVVEDFQNSILEQLYSAYEHKMYSIAYSILNNSGQAEDAVQDAFIKLIPYLEHINEISSMETKRLITYTIKNIAIDKYRKNKKESELFHKGIDEPVISENQHKFDSIKAIEDRQIVSQLVSRLPAKYREIIRYHCYYDLSYKEISVLLNISEKVAAKRYERAREWLKKVIEKEMIGDELHG